MIRISVILVSLFIFFTKCKYPSVELASSRDPDIVLVNIERGDREFIGKLLLKLDSLNPLVIGIDVKFQGRKEQDSILIDAFEKIKNDILVCSVKQDGVITGSDTVFTNLVHDQGNLYYEERLGLITTMTPLQKINDAVHESFALKIIRYWKPDFGFSNKVE
jgi:CHASE2 domain-containing sensor protein